MSEGCLDAIEQIIMYRYDAGLQVVVTTNRDVNGLAQERGHRMMSRLRGMTNDKFVVLDGDDWRASNAEA
jgi:DNA replication protein DnaC